VRGVYDHGLTGAKRLFGEIVDASPAIQPAVTHEPMEGWFTPLDLSPVSVLPCGPDVVSRPVLLLIRRRPGLGAFSRLQPLDRQRRSSGVALRLIGGQHLAAVENGPMTHCPNYIDGVGPCCEHDQKSFLRKRGERRESQVSTLENSAALILLNVRADNIKRRGVVRAKLGER